MVARRLNQTRHPGTWCRDPRLSSSPKAWIPRPSRGMTAECNRTSRFHELDDAAVGDFGGDEAALAGLFDRHAAVPEEVAAAAFVGDLDLHRGDPGRLVLEQRQQGVVERLQALRGHEADAAGAG